MGDRPTESMQALARRLLAVEAGRSASTDERGGSETGPSGEDAAPGREAVRVVEKLRLALTRFAGPAGFAALFLRALALARAEVGVESPSGKALGRVRIRADGGIEGFEPASGSAEADPAAVALVANLLGLLVNFIGEALTMSLLREAWPDEFRDGSR